MELKTTKVLYLYDLLVLKEKELSTTEIITEFDCCIESVYNYIRTINNYFVDTYDYTRTVIYDRSLKKYKLIKFD